MTKYLPHGTTFKINSKLVGGLISVSIPSMERGAAETTDTNSASNRAFIPALRDGGTVELTFRHDPDDLGQQELESNYAAAGSAAVQDCILTLPDAATTAGGSRTYSFDGFVVNPPSGDLGLVDDEAAELTATIKVTGAVTIYP